MKYYRGNEIYRALENARVEKFKFSYKDSWSLVYGSKRSDSILLLYVLACDENRYYSNKLKEKNSDYLNCLKYLAHKSNVPLCFIKFRNDINEIEKVMFSKDSENFREIYLYDLKNIFVKDYNLPVPVEALSTKKYLNDSISSAYHKWQRENLGANIVVSDIDLLVVNPKTKSPEAIVELKRSKKIPIEKWEPLPEDYPNFRLISSLCKRAKLRFKIVFTQILKGNKEDISRLKIFTVDFHRKTPITGGKIISWHDFLENEWYKY